MERIYSNGSRWATLSAMVVFLMAGVGAKCAVQVQGASFQESGSFFASPRCGPYPAFLEGQGTSTGTDTLGGGFTFTLSFCLDNSDPNSPRIFDYLGTQTYLRTGEQATVHSDDYVEIVDLDPNTGTCAAVPEKPVKFTIDGYTGEHTGGRLIGHYTYVNNAGFCSGLDIPSISSFEGVFTPNAPNAGN